MIAVVLLGGGVLIGVAALSVDVGKLYAEREQLQSGADAAAIAVATAVDTKICLHDSSVTSYADFVACAAGYADLNANDGASAIKVCGSGINGLPGCGAPVGNLTDCLGDPPAGKYVEVRATTENDDGSTLLPPALAQAMLGNEGYQGTTVGACARVSWDSLSAATSLAVTFHTCYWSEYTNDGTSYPTTERKVYLKAGSGCDAGPDAPGNFGWLDNAGLCTAEMAEGNTMGGDPGNNVTHDCRDRLYDLWQSHEPVVLPLFDEAYEEGQHGYYHITGFASFVITGYYLSGTRQKSWVSHQYPCSGNERCISGYFTQDGFNGIGGGSTNFGATARTLSG